MTPPSVYEGAAAEHLSAGPGGQGVPSADGSDEAGRVYGAAAAAGYRLPAPPGGRGTGRGRTYRSPHRPVAPRRLAHGMGWGLLRERGAIGRAFGGATDPAGGLGPLPAWVRRRGRVRRWVRCKPVNNAARIPRHRQPMQRLQWTGKPLATHQPPLRG